MSPLALAIPCLVLDAVSGGDDPALGDEGAPAADPLAEEALLDDGNLHGGRSGGGETGGMRFCSRTFA